MADGKKYNEHLLDRKSDDKSCTGNNYGEKKASTKSETYIKPFASILGNNTFSNYAIAKGFELSFAPLPVDVVGHLKLLHAFSVLKDEVTNSRRDERATKLWQLYVTNAVRRFIIFISALKQEDRHEYGRVSGEQTSSKSHDRARKIAITLGRLLPPLDVIMVWHTFSLNPLAYYDFLVRNHFGHFHGIPLPLDQLNMAIDNESFKYIPNEQLRIGYVQMVAKFSETIDHEYDSFLDNNNTTYDLECPVCKRVLLVAVNLTNEMKTGFADPGFDQPKSDSEKDGCTCKFSADITHDNLRLRQLYCDMNSEKSLPNSFKHFSDVYKLHPSEDGKSFGILANLKSRIKNYLHSALSVDDLETSIQIAVLNLRKIPEYEVILGQYPKMNLIHLSVRGGVEVLEDLVSSVMRQERFWTKITQIQWLYSPMILDSVIEATERYLRFQELVKKNENKRDFLPTLDIDMVWHTHQLFPKKYLDDTIRATNGIVINHEDTINEELLDFSFQKTCTTWHKAFDEDYTCCPCPYCQKSKSKSKSRQFWKSSSIKNPNSNYKLYLTPGLCELTHISLHSHTQLIQPECARSVQKDKIQLLPWESDQTILPFALYPHLYVIPPLSLVVTDNFNNQITKLKTK